MSARVRVSPGSRFLLLDLDAIPVNSIPIVVAAACRISEEKASADVFSFMTDGIAHTKAVLRVRTSRPPVSVFVGEKPLGHEEFEMDGDTLLVRFVNSGDPLRIEIYFHDGTP